MAAVTLALCALPVPHSFSVLGELRSGTRGSEPLKAEGLHVDHKIHLGFQNGMNRSFFTGKRKANSESE
jgi:hypothetical protein